MAFETLCKTDDVWEGEMDSFDTETGVSVLVLGLGNGEYKAYQAMCPHQEVELVEGEFDGKVLTCKAHLWQFEACNGKGINPKDCQLAEYPLRIDGDTIQVDVDGIEPFMSDL